MSLTGLCYQGCIVIYEYLIPTGLRFCESSNFQNKKFAIN